jgi:glycosyltransferase involved in cell wall biosynthesis
MTGQHERENRIPLSVLIPVKNEASNLPDCLESVSFADEIVVVDSASNDDTAKIAEEAGARVVQFQRNGQFPRKKNWALEHIPWRNEWILIIDADERITPALEAQIRPAITRSGVDGYYLNRRFWFMEGWINHCGYFPSWNLRLFRHHKGRYEKFEANDLSSGDNEVHEHVLLSGVTEYLSEPMLHYAFPDITTFVEKHNRYSNWEADVRRQMQSSSSETLAGNLSDGPLQRRRWLKRASLHLPFRPAMRFFYHFVMKQGFRDGYRGWTLCRLLAWYEFLCTVKERERTEKVGSRK